MTAMPAGAIWKRRLWTSDLGADIDAARRLVDDQYLRPERQPARQHDLLLIAAGEIADELVRARHADVEKLAVLLDQRVLLCRADEDAVEMRSCAAIERLVADREREEQGLLLAVFRHEPDAVSDRIRGERDGDRLSLDRISARIERIGAEDGPRRLGPAGADEPGNAENLALAHRQRDIMEFDGARIGARVPRREMFFASERHVDGVVKLCVRARQEAELAPDHQADDPVESVSCDRPRPTCRPSRSTV